MKGSGSLKNYTSIIMLTGCCLSRSRRKLVTLPHRGERSSRFLDSLYSRPSPLPEYPGRLLLYYSLFRLFFLPYLPSLNVGTREWPRRIRLVPTPVWLSSLQLNVLKLLRNKWRRWKKTDEIPKTNKNFRYKKNQRNFLHNNNKKLKWHESL